MWLSRSDSIWGLLCCFSKIFFSFFWLEHFWHLYWVCYNVAPVVYMFVCKVYLFWLPWDSPGKNTGVGCHFLLQCMKVKSESEVAQSCPTLSDPMDCSLPGSSVHGIFHARVLEWDAIAFSDLSFSDCLISLSIIPCYSSRSVVSDSLQPHGL